MSLVQFRSEKRYVTRQGNPDHERAGQVRTWPFLSIGCCAVRLRRQVGRFDIVLPDRPRRSELMFYSAFILRGKSRKVKAVGAGADGILPVDIFRKIVRM